jgi:putative oxidoreductase
MSTRWKEALSIPFEPARSVHAWITSKLGHHAALPLRLIVGYGFMAHGYAKIVHGPEQFINILHTMSVPAPAIMGWATILVALVGGLAVLVGAFVPR